ncbi:SGNH/GDSL hydrolase family protein [uncultured Psychroserpens sp.]|uniref:SGNH/GDSL hydrolase family protein n=1 Tax=uncultured Psychroserpens sp. TaxID=255436 RepID=UPI00262989FE|nr:SGNH/GDSL hydrolase family protein [uncultured Psychroserpens sp.]
MNFKQLTFCFSIVFFVAFYSYGFQKENEIRYKGIERTLGILHSSSKENPKELSVLFYGQSIIGGMKPVILIDSLEKTFPYTTIDFKQKAIGGFTVPLLIKTAEHDLFHENPDLIIFHAYEGIKDGLLDSLVRRIREKMTSEILLLNHHYVWSTPRSHLKFVNESHDLDSKEIEKIAKKYQCGFLDVRRYWRAYLKHNNIKANKLVGNTVKPDVHPNAKGNKLLRQIILSKLRSKPKVIYNKENDGLRTDILIDDESKQIKTEFVGNRLELFMDEQEEKTPIVVEVLIDKKKPSTFREFYYVTRPSKGFKSHMPAIKRVSLGPTLPREEDWTITITDIDRVNKTFIYSLYGSLTGFDGSGHSDLNFVSNSNRIHIEKGDFHIFNIEDIVEKNTPQNFKIKFSVKTHTKDTIVIPHYKSKCVLYHSRLVGNHELELNILKGDRKIKKLIAFKPFLSNNE